MAIENFPFFIPRVTFFAFALFCISEMRVHPVFIGKIRNTPSSGVHKKYDENEILTISYETCIILPYFIIAPEIWAVIAVCGGRF